MATHLHGPRTTTLIGLAAAAALTAPARAQDSTLVLLLRTGPEMPKNVMEGTLKAGLEATRREQKLARIVAENPVVRQISPVEYGFYNSVINAVEDSTPLTKARNGALELRQLVTAEPAWQLKLTNKEPSALRSLKVTFTDGSARDFDPVKDSRDLSLTQAGTYTLRLPPDKVPEKYEAEFETLGKKMIPFKGEWPKADNFFLIRLKGFVGDRDLLVKTLRDANKVPDPLDDLRIGKDVVLAIGEAQATDNEPSDEELRGNKMLVTVPPLRRGTQKRAWMLFPLTDAQASEQLSRFKGKSGEEVASMIRESKPAGAGQAVVITDTSASGWVELSRLDGEVEGFGSRNGLFGRVITLGAMDSGAVTTDDYKKLMDKYPAARRLLVYEFDDGSTVSAVRYKPFASKPAGYVHVTELGNWSVLLNRAVASKADPKTDPKH